MTAGTDPARSGQARRPLRRRTHRNVPKTPPEPSLVVVRRRDVRALRGSTPPPAAVYSFAHGGDTDPRYPSRRRLRTWLAFPLDMLLHLAVGVAAAALISQQAGLITILAVGFGGYVFASGVHRTLLQASFATTFGKAIFGLRMIQDTDGADPTLRQYTEAWLLGLIAVLAILLD